jgi:3-dehydroquinate synthetase
LFATALSKKLEDLDKNELKLLYDVLLCVGKLPDTNNINLTEVTDAFAFDKKTVGKSLQWILLEEIGKPVIVENKDISPSIVHETLKEVLHSNLL